MTPELFLELYTSVSWEPPCKAQAEAALTAYDGEQAVGMLRLIGDGGMGFEERPCEWDGPGMFRMIR